MNPDTASTIRRQLLAALAGTRRPGFHFPGYLMQIRWPHIGTENIVEELPASPFSTDADGNADPAALGVLIDTSLATAPRLAIETGARQATVQLSAQFTGIPARGNLHMEARLEGFTDGGGVRQALTRGVMTAGGRPVCFASGTFVVLPPPPGVTLAPLPWQEKDYTDPQPLKPAELDDRERSVLRACNAAMRRADSQHAITDHFWGLLPRLRPDGASISVKIAAQHANRVGHVQGGLLFGLAAATARAAAPRHPRLSSISAWYISPGQGKSLSVRSRAIHSGRSFAVVRTEIRNADRSLVLEVVSNHAA